MEHLYLVHHGIKGQHWGERNYQYKDGSLTPAGKLRYLKNNRTKTNSAKKLSEDGVIKKDTEFKRLTTNFSEKPSSRPNWVNYKKSDADYYRSFYPEMLGKNMGRRNGTGANVVFENTLQATKDLKVAGDKTWNKIVDDIIDRDDFSDRLARVSYNYKKGQKIKKEDQASINAYKNMIEECKKNNREFIKGTIASYQQLADTDLSSEIFKKARNLGYDAFKDMYATKYGNETKDSLILLTPKEAVKKVNTSIIAGSKGVDDFGNKRTKAFKKASDIAATAALMSGSASLYSIPTLNPALIGITTGTTAGLTGVSVAANKMSKIASRSLVKDPEKYIKSLSNKKYDNLIKTVQSSKQKDFEEYAKKVRSGKT